MTVKAKCPGCGDEEETVSVTRPVRCWADTETWCGACGKTSVVRGCAMPGEEPRTLTDADVEAIARRVVELMKF